MESAECVNREYSGIGRFLSQCDDVADPAPSTSTSDLPSRTYEIAEDDPFFCNLCNVSCNSDAMLLAHVNGKGHLKKLNIKVPKKPKEPPANQAGKTAGFETLSSRLSSSEEAGIGLQYIEEFWPENPNSNMEPRYTCSLCCVTAEVCPMFNHVIGHKHRVKYMEMRLGWRNISKSEVAEHAMRIQEMEGGKNIDLINIVVSNEKYPWPNKEDNPNAESAMPLFITDKDLPSLSLSPTDKLLRTISNSAVKSDDDALIAYDVSKALVTKLAEYTGAGSRMGHDALRIIEEIYNFGCGNAGNLKDHQSENELFERANSEQGHGNPHIGDVNPPYGDTYPARGGQNPGPVANNPTGNLAFGDERNANPRQGSQDPPHWNQKPPHRNNNPNDRGSRNPQQNNPNPHHGSRNPPHGNPIPPLMGKNPPGNRNPLDWNKRTSGSRGRNPPSENQNPPHRNTNAAHGNQNPQRGNQNRSHGSQNPRHGNPNPPRGNPNPSHGTNPNYGNKSSPNLPQKRPFPSENNARGDNSFGRNSSMGAQRDAYKSSNPVYYTSAPKMYGKNQRQH